LHQGSFSGIGFGFELGCFFRAPLFVFLPRLLLHLLNIALQRHEFTRPNQAQEIK
jgi:hypothetical protein